MDLRVLKPILLYNNFYKCEVFQVSCNVLKIIDIGTKHPKMEIEIVDFNSGKIKKITAKTYPRTVGHFQNSGINFPVRTLCNVVKRNGDINYFVSGILGDIGTVYEVAGLYRNLTEDQLILHAKLNYAEFNEWINS